jgi:fluoroquinolone resistance protein
MDEKYYENQRFENIKMSEETLEGYEFYDCEFINCTLEECTLEKCHFMGCKFHGCTIISLQAEYTQMKNGEFIGCNLVGIHWTEVLPVGKIADPIHKLTDCLLKYNTFINMNFMKFNFSGNIIQDSAFDECNLNESDFKGCKLNTTQFSKCDMRKADFREAAGYLIDISSNKMRGAKFSFPEVLSLLNELGIEVS